MLKLTIISPSEFDLTQIKSYLSSTCDNLGIEYKLMNYTVKFQDPRNTVKSIESIINKELAQSNQTNMFWFIIPNSFKTHYSSLKKLVLKEGIEVNSQVCLVSTLQKKGFASVFTKILLQMSAKIGNKLWVPKVSKEVPSSGILLIGIENYGDQQNKSMNILSYCCNTNR